MAEKAKLDYELEYPDNFAFQDAYKHICYTRANNFSEDSV